MLHLSQQTIDLKIEREKAESNLQPKFWSNYAKGSHLVSKSKLKLYPNALIVKVAFYLADDYQQEQSWKSRKLV